MSKVNLTTSIKNIREAEMLGDDEFPWLSYFDMQFDARVRQTLVSITAAGSNPYNPLLVEQLFTDITVLLNRLLSYQRDYWNLEQAALQYARGYEAFTKQRENLKELEQATYLLRVIEVQKELQKEVTKAFEVQDPLAAGFAKGAEVTQKVSEELSAEWVTRQNLISEKYALIDNFQKQLKERHKIAGSPLAFSERASNLWEFVASDLKEAYLKMQAASVGIEKVYRLKATTLPELPAWKPGQATPKEGEDDSLTRLVNWARTVIEWINVEEEQYSRFELIIPLRKTVTEPVKFTLGVVEAKDFDSWLDPAGAGRLSVNLDKAIPPGVTNLRLRAVGASFAPRVGGDPVFGQRSARLSLVVFPPPVPPECSVGGNVNRALILSTVAMADPYSAVHYESSDLIKNLDPVSDSPWQIQISPVLYAAVGATSARAVPAPPATADISQVYLHLLVSGKIGTAVKKWESAVDERVKI